MRYLRIFLITIFLLVLTSCIENRENNHELKLINTINTIEDSMSKFSISSDNEHIAYIQNKLNEIDNTIVIKDLISGEEKFIETDILFIDVKLCPSANIFSYIDYNSLNIVFSDEGFNEFEKKSIKHRSFIPKITWSKDCRYLALSDYTELKIYETETLNEIILREISNNIFYPTAKWSPNNKLFAFNDINGNIEIYNNNSWEKHTSIHIENEIFDFEFYDDENLLISTEEYLLLINIASKNEIKRIIHSEKRFKTILWSKTNEILVNSSEVNQNLELWDIEEGKMIIEIDESTYHNSFEFFLNESYLAFLHSREFNLLYLEELITQ